MEQDISTRPFDEREEDLGNEQILQNAQGETARNLDAGSLLKYYKEEAAAARREAAEEAYRKKQQGSNGNGEDGDTDRTISEDIYSLIYTANVCSQAFAFALFIFLLQELLLLLILYDLVDMRHYDSNNPLQLPAGVPLTVNVAQAISMILIVVTILCESADLTNGLLLLLDGYQPSILQKNPHATCLKWFCAGIFQCFAGSLMTIVLFILVMQSTTVISLALNFAALSFIYEIDNITFAMGKQGFLTKKIKKACQTVTEHRIPKIANRNRRRIVKPTLIFLMATALFIPYGFLVHRQWDSQFLCRRVFIQFDDVMPQLTYFTGHFDLHRRDDTFLGGFRARLDDRVYYEDITKSVRLAYCQSEEAWTISPTSSDDHCQYYAYKSSSTVAFDVTKIAGSQWYGWDLGIQRLVPAPGFNLRCDDCVGGERGNCHPENGVCVSNVCECLDTRMGVHCDNEVPVCESLRVDMRTNPLPYEDGSLFSDEYEIFRSANTQNIVEVQFKPVYIMKKPWEADFMFFNGRRWEIVRPISKDKQRTLTRNMKPWTQAREQPPRRLVSGDDPAELIELGTAKSLAALFLEIQMAEQEGNTTASLNETVVDADGKQLFRTFFFSQPVKSLSPEDTLTPAGLDWYPSARDSSLGWALPDESRSLGTNFLCATCDPVSNACMNEGECNPGTQRCDCKREFDGSLCEHTISCHELSCQNNGTCAQWNEYCTCDEPYYGSLCQYVDWASLEFLVEV